MDNSNRLWVLNLCDELLFSIGLVCFLALTYLNHSDRGWWFLCSSADADDVHLDDAHPPSSAVSHSSLYSIRSPGWQSSSRQRASSVENRRALILLFLIRAGLRRFRKTLIGTKELRRNFSRGDISFSGFGIHSRSKKLPAQWLRPSSLRI